MLELKLGFMTTKELAEWCNRSESYIIKNKKNWCEKNLTIYASYSLTRGGVIIKEIKNPIFLSSGLQEVREKYRKYWGYENLNVDTNTQCWIKLSKNMVNKIEFKTGRNYVCQCRREDYGVARKKNKYTGKRGYCHYIFCKSINDQPCPFTEEEIQIKNKLAQKYLKTNEQDEIEKQALTQEFIRGELSSEEYATIIAELTTNDRGWSIFQTELNKALGCETDFFIQIVDDAIKYVENNIPFSF